MPKKQLVCPLWRTCLCYCEVSKVLYRLDFLLKLAPHVVTDVCWSSFYARFRTAHVLSVCNFWMVENGGYLKCFLTRSFEYYILCSLSVYVNLSNLFTVFILFSTVVLYHLSIGLELGWLTRWPPIPWSFTNSMWKSNNRFLHWSVFWSLYFLLF